MHKVENRLFSKAQRYVVAAVCFGTILECYELYLYVFWAPVLSSLFFNSSSTMTNLFAMISLFAIGFFFRPLGGILFGRLGDRFGRKKAFVLSIVCMTIPSFLLSVIPVYAQIGILSPILLGIARILQTLPTGGELPGAFCYLYENADSKNRKLMSSFAGVGNLIGIGLSALESFWIEKYSSPEFAIQWGWRISFVVGGFIGLTGFYLRNKLHETVMFRELVVHHKMHRQSILSVIKNNRKQLLIGISYGAVQTVSFHVISVLFPVYSDGFFDIKYGSILLFLISSLGLMAIVLPIFGWIGDRIGVKKLVVGSSLGMLLVMYPLYYLLGGGAPLYAAILISSMFFLCISCITAVWPYLLCSLFDTRVRYTCIGVSFNLSDGVFGGLSLILVAHFTSVTSNPSALVWMLLAGVLISLFSFLKIKESY